MKRYIKSASGSEMSGEYELSHPEQEYDSANTSINSKKLPAIYNMVSFHPNQIVLDFGGGKFDNAVEYLASQNVTLLVYDPYNRSNEHNNQVLRTLKTNGGADVTLCSNVLNVIKELDARLAVLNNIQKLTKPGGDIYITVYEGSGKRNEGPTKSGYQLNRKTADYLEEIQSVFPDATRRGKLVHATNNTAVTSSSIIASLDINDIRQGDLVDFGAYGKLYVCNPYFSDRYFWVTDDEEDRDNPHALGWSILKETANYIIESFSDTEDDDDYYD